MKIIRLSHPTKKVIGKIQIPGSKSESNRLLFLQAMYFPEMEISGLSNSRDTALMQQLINASLPEVDIRDAGTAMRFGTAYLSAKAKKKYRLTGSKRMQKRPIGILVEALRKVGAQIEYVGDEGFPPLNITGGRLKGGTIKMDASVSSQFISALMMLGPGMLQPLHIKLSGTLVSTPYWQLTGHIMRSLGFKVLWEGGEIWIENEVPKLTKNISVEPDWTAASYWYLQSLLAQKAEVFLTGFKEHSLQGDAFVSDLFEPLGVQSLGMGTGFRLRVKPVLPKTIEVNLVHNPDLAQSLAVAYAAKNIRAKITGLQSLKIKETDRLHALKKELEKTGAQIEIGPDFLGVKKGIEKVEGLCFDTYEDHRMAMCLAPLALLGSIQIKNPEVVNKSYPTFWADLEKVGFHIYRESNET